MELDFNQNLNKRQNFQQSESKSKYPKPVLESRDFNRISAASLFILFQLSNLRHGAYIFTSHLLSQSVRNGNSTKISRNVVIGAVVRDFEHDSFSGRVYLDISDEFGLKSLITPCYLFLLCTILLDLEGGMESKSIKKISTLFQVILLELKTPGTPSRHQLLFIRPFFL